MHRAGGAPPTLSVGGSSFFLSRMAALSSLSIAIFVALCQLQSSFSQQPDVSDPCASSATQLHNGDAAYFPTFDYSTGSEQGGGGEGDGRRKRAATSLDNRLWPGGVIYYNVSHLYTDDENRTIFEAMKHWEDNTCIRFQQRTTQKDYINIFPGSGCCSYVGRLGYGLQGVSLSRACLAFHTVVHELGHVIGFWHEQSRPDRDEYIEVILDNVIDGYESNFDKKKEDEVDSQGVGYDYNSIMHYDRDFFARFSGFDTILARDRSIPIGMARELSELDIIQTNRLYECDVDNMPPPKVVLGLPPTAPTLPPLPFPSCGEVLTNATGSFSSPGYDHFSHNTDCAWMIDAPEGHWIRLTLNPLRIEYTPNCVKDYISFQTSFEAGATARKVCGHYFSYRYSTRVNTVLVSYHTDANNDVDTRPAYGFQLSYQSFDINECYEAGCTQVCTNFPGSYSCSCREGWFLSADGATCFDMNECALESGGCEQHCTNTGGSFYCTCDDGFQLEPDGKRCRVPGTSCTFRNGGCSQHCNDTGVSRVCSCDAGYSLEPDQRSCHDIDECAVSASTHGCQHICLNTPGSYRCECNDGFLLDEDGLSCSPDRICAENNGGCSHTCSDSSNGAAVCSCPQGYHVGSDQKTCEDTDECYNSRLCGHTCVNTNGSYHCECRDGYSLDSDGVFCRNIDECRDGSNKCQFKDRCRDNHGSYTCSCPTGYTLNEDGHSCDDVDECSQGYHICSHICHNIDGSYECKCPEGFTFQDQYTCRDIDECAEGLHHCNHTSGATCKNTEGSYDCLCQDGYKTDSLGFSCIDVDECAEGSHDCKEGSDCVNYEGYYECICSVGYTLSEDGATCEPITTTGLPTTATTTQETLTTTTTVPSHSVGTTTDSNAGLNSPRTTVDNVRTDSITSTGYPAAASNSELTTTEATATALVTNAATTDATKPTTDESSMTTKPTTYSVEEPSSTVVSTTTAKKTDITTYFIEEQQNSTEDELISTMASTTTTKMTDETTTYSIEEPPTSTMVDATTTKETDKPTTMASTTTTKETDETTTMASTTTTKETDETTTMASTTTTKVTDETTTYSTEEPPTSTMVDATTTELVSTTEPPLVGACLGAGCGQRCRTLYHGFFAQCYCRDGFVLAGDRKTCNDIDECSSRNGGCNTFCWNTDGSYECLCVKGFELEDDKKTCKDVNECEENNGGCEQMCINTPGSFSCNCQPNYYLAIDGQTCVPLHPLPPSSTSFPPSSTPQTTVTMTDGTTTAAATTAPPTVTTEPPTTPQPQCGGKLNSSSGDFQTLNWPETYPVNVDCEWTIELPDGSKVVEISFDSSVYGIAGRMPDCEKDWIKIYDGLDTDNAHMWGPLCYFTLPSDIKTSSNNAKVLFHAGPGHSPSRKGFKATYRSVDGTTPTTTTATPPTTATNSPTTDTPSPTTLSTTSVVTTEHPTVSLRECGSDFKSKGGVFQSKNWPETYPVNVDCEWNIEIPDSKKVIEISFESSVYGIAGNMPDCEKDWLKIYNGADTNASMWGPYCYFTLPSIMHTSSNRAKVLFHAGARHSPSRKGFKAFYRSINSTLPIAPRNPTGTFTCNSYIVANSKFGPPEFPNLITTDTVSSCYWTLFASNNRNYALRISYFDIPSTSDGCLDNSLKVYRNNIRSSSNLLATLCGDLGGDEIVIEGGNNFMTVVMEINDRSNMFRGFYGHVEEK